MREDLDRLRSVIADATSHITPEYFLLPVAAFQDGDLSLRPKAPTAPSSHLLGHLLPLLPLLRGEYGLQPLVGLFADFFVAGF